MRIHLIMVEQGKRMNYPCQRVGDIEKHGHCDEDREDMNCFLKDNKIAP